MRVVLDHITKRFADVTAVSEFSATLEDGELVSLLGPSGCGKSTLLNMLSGILPVSGGKIYFDDQDVTSMPPEKRGIGLVFQNYALYPHMTVMGNICFPLETQRVPKAERIERANEIAKLVHVDMLMNRKPSELSGGQQQRVAIARAFACGGEQPLFRDCIGIRRIERLRRYVQDHRCQFHSAPVYQRFAESPRKGEQIYAFRESPALVPDSPAGPAFWSIPRPFDRAKQRPRTSAWRSPTWRSPTACPKRRKARRRARHIPEPRTMPRFLPAGFPYFETSITPAAFRSGLPSRFRPGPIPQHALRSV